MSLGEFPIIERRGWITFSRLEHDVLFDSTDVLIEFASYCSSGVEAKKEETRPYCFRACDQATEWRGIESIELFD